MTDDHLRFHLGSVVAQRTMVRVKSEKKVED